MVVEDGRVSPLRNLPIRAGGGRPTNQVEHTTVNAFSPVLQSHLKKIYSSLSAYNHDASSNLDQPPLDTYDEFLSWFKSPAASALAPPPKHDLSYPISNYYISSSHNTYLSGNQLYGSASGDAYRNVLVRGCRCLEIDVWDGEDDDSSVSSSDYEEFGHTGHSEHKNKHEGGRERANSRLTRFTHRVKDKAQRMRSPGRSPGPSHGGEHGKTAEYQTQVQSQSLGVPTIAEIKQWKAEPRVYHGFTLTKDIPFRLVCHAIRDSAFEATDLPIIVSLEVHCCFEQQETMVEIMRNVFKDHLLDISKESANGFHALPSPDQLRKKILIKVKWTTNPETGESNNPLEQVETEETEPTDEPANPEKKKKAAKIIQALSDLGVYTRAYTFKHFGQPEAKIPTHVFSLSEAKVEDIHADAYRGPSLFEHNRNFLMRVFPSGIRVDSSNVEPCFLWRQGAQMVALNWQKLDKGTMLNEGMFAGEEGWVLKPEGFRGVCKNHNDGAQPTPHPTRQLLDLEVELIAAQNLPLPPGKDPSHLAKLKPYVKIQLHVDTHGPPGQVVADVSEDHAFSRSRYGTHHSRRDSDDEQDEVVRKLKRKSSVAKSADPDFSNELMEWRRIHDVVDELSFLR